MPAGPAWRDQGWAHDFGGLLKLAGGRARSDAETGETVVLLAWQAPGAVADDWSVSVRLTEKGREVAQMDRDCLAARAALARDANVPAPSARPLPRPKGPCIN